MPGFMRLASSLIAMAVIVAATTLAAGVRAASPEPRPPLRVVSYNIRHGVGTDGRLDLERIAEVIRRLEPDLVALQEVDESCGRSGNVDQAAVLGRALGMHHRFAAFMDFDGGRYGLAALSRFPITASRRHELPAGAEPRALLELELAVDGLEKPLSFSCVHADWTSEVIRTKQMRTVLDAIGGRPGPAILAGDFNAEPGSDSLQLLGKSGWRLLDKLQQAGGKTWPADSPTDAIDHIAVRGIGEVVAHRVVEEPTASDHRPILAELTLAAGQAAARPAARNVVFILADDHRHDFLGFHPQAPEWLETPSLDRLAAEGIHFANAFVTTSLCSPSRASILTGQYMHHHRVVDNQRAVPAGTRFFPRDLQAAGIETAFVGKWHMGHDDDSPRPGFDHWASFRGQGVYFDPEINVNGHRRQFEGYTTDVLTDLAVRWLKTGRDPAKRFYLTLSLKAVHYPFEPAPRHRGRYDGKPIDWPETRARTERNYRSQPNWVRQRRYSIHGIDHMETGPFDKDPVPDLDALYRRYAECVQGVDENIGRLMQVLEETGLADETLVIFMGDNGFHLGEHGFYDKRDAFETSIRVPLLARPPGGLPAGRRVEAMLLNIDIAPTILAAMGVAPHPEAAHDGASGLAFLVGKKPPAWRDHMLYEYHWEWNFPATPTLFALRTDRYKYVYHHGVWDLDALYDLQTDPHERHNLIQVPAFAELAERLRTQLFEELAASGGLEIPVRPPAGERLDQRKLP